MLHFTVFDPASRQVLSHKVCSHPDDVLLNVPEGMLATPGHLDRSQPVPEDVDLIVPSEALPGDPNHDWPISASGRS